MTLPATDLLLTTKAHRPGVAPAAVERSSLLAQLDQSLAYRLILISAPPGFGKTTLVCQWLTRIEQRKGSLAKVEADAQLSAFALLAAQVRTAWLSLDAGDNRLAQFLRYLVAAVRSAAPEACSTIKELLAAPTLPEVEYLANVLAGDLAALPAPLVLVLDDYHLITAPEVHGLVDHLLRYPPPLLRLVILTRSDPPLHLARLRLEQAVTELRAASLRFAPEETSKLFARRLGRPLDPELVQALHARTEGWVSGLQIASIALQHEEPRQFLARFHGGDRLLSAYLLEEVLAHLSPTLSEFLLRTAMLESFCAPLAEALFDSDHLPQGGQTLIDELQARNLFLVSLDDAGIWYRYHELFRAFLRAQLQRRGDPALITRIHQRAGAWLVATGQIDAALAHLRALLADGTPPALTAALQLAETCLEQAEGAYNSRQTITLLALQALALQGARRPEEAARALGRALTLAESGGLMRTFLELGAPMAELLRSYTASHPQFTYARRLVAAFAGEPGQARLPTVAGAAMVAGAGALTPREGELLILLAQRLTVEEIAARLVISSNTVKKHVANIYAKLGAANRREASAKARALGLLPPE